MQAVQDRVLYLVESPACGSPSERRWYDELDKPFAEAAFEKSAATMREVAAKYGQSWEWSQSSVRLIEFRQAGHLTMADFLNGYNVRQRVIRSVGLGLRVKQLADDSPAIQDIVNRLIKAEDSLDALGGIISNDDRVSGALQRSLASHTDDALSEIMGIVTEYATLASPGKWVVADAC